MSQIRFFLLVVLGFSSSLLAEEITPPAVTPPIEIPITTLPISPLPACYVVSCATPICPPNTKADTIQLSTSDDRPILFCLCCPAK